MTDPGAVAPAQAGRPRWRRPAWLAVAALAVVAVTVAVTVAVLRGGGSPGPASTGPTRPTASLPSPSVTASECTPRVAESGFAKRYGFRSGQQVAPEDGAISFGVVLENPCPRSLAAHASLLVTAVDQAGAELARYTWSLSPIGPAQRLGVGGEIDNPGHTQTGRAQSGFDATAVARIVAVVRGAQWLESGAADPRAGRVITGAVIGQRGQDGVAPVTFTFSPNDVTEASWCSVIFRDAGGAIVSGALTRSHRVQVAASGEVTMRVEVWAPADPSGLRAEVYFLTSV